MSVSRRCTLHRAAAPFSAASLKHARRYLHSHIMSARMMNVCAARDIKYNTPVRMFAAGTTTFWPYSMKKKRMCANIYIYIYIYIYTHMHKHICTHTQVTHKCIRSTTVFDILYLKRSQYAAMTVTCLCHTYGESGHIVSTGVHENECTHKQWPYKSVAYSSSLMRMQTST